MLIVLPPLRIGFFSPIMQEIRERLIFLYGIRVIVNGLEIRDELVNLPRL